MRYSPEENRRHAERIRVHGYTVLEELLPRDRVERMRECFPGLLAAQAEREGFNRGAQRLQMYLPWEPPFADPLLYENDTVLAVVEAVLGSDPALVYFASDTPLPGSDYQRVHSDTRPLFPETGFPVPAYGLVLNIPLVDCTEENGSLEFWPGGTHFSPCPADPEPFVRDLPSRRANLPAGTALLRDLRMWHRGTPNRSSQPRPHLALVYVRPWYRFEQQVPELTAEAFEKLSPRARHLLRYARVG